MVVQGLAYIDSWGNLRYVSNQALMGLLHNKLYPDNSKRSTVYACFARKQMRYILGADTQQSYVVGKPSTRLSLQDSVCSVMPLSYVCFSKAHTVKAFHCATLESVDTLISCAQQTSPCVAVGVGIHPGPCQAHHRAASCGMLGTPCDCSAYLNTGCNPNIIYGALVGGPDVNDEFVDQRSNYQQAEVAVDWNAGFTGVLRHLSFY